MEICYSIIIPAYNEAAYLPATLTAAAAAQRAVAAPGEIIVVDNNSTDATAQIARTAGVGLAFEAIRQIARARNAGVRLARGRHFVFVDADTLINPALLAATIDLLESGAYCGGGSRVRFENETPGFARFTAHMWDRLAIRYQLAAGCYMFVTRRAYDAVGGFSQQLYAGEDLKFARAVRRWGGRTGQKFKILTEHPPLTSSRKLQWFTSAERVLAVTLMLFFPITARFKRLCHWWYYRPPG
jgi:glycosyltransferase involved in cell wall biosynthesis